jgi:signal peptide peptidase SppA
MKYPHLATRLYNTPLLLEPRRAEIIERVLRTHETIHAGALDPATGIPQETGESSDRHGRPAARPPARAAAVPGARRADKPYDMTDAGIALIPIVGTLVQRTGGMQPFSGMIPYAYVGNKLQAAIEDPDVRGILLEIDSPGGEVNGCFDLAQQILDAREKKRIWAVANEVAYSAAYALASAASKLYVPKTGGVGSIGVIMLHIDQSRRDQAQGLAYSYIYAGERKKDFNPHEPLSSEARTRGQAEVDRLYGIFVKHVARARGLSPETVRASEAAVMNPDVALAEGYVDGVKTFAEALAELEVAAKSPMLNGALRPVPGPAARAPGGPRQGNTPAAASRPNEATRAPTPAALSEAIAKRSMKQARARGLDGEAAKRYAAIVAQGMLQERARIAAILTSPAASGRTRFALHCALETDFEPGEALAAVSQAPVDSYDAGAPRFDIAGFYRQRNAKLPATPSQASEDARASAMVTWTESLAKRGMEQARAQSLEGEAAKAFATSFADGVLLERARIAAILTSPAASGRTKLAQHCAFETDLEPKEAVATMSFAPIDRSDPLGAAGHSGPAADEPDSGAARIDAADVFARRKNRLH